MLWTMLIIILGLILLVLILSVRGAAAGPTAS